MLSDYTGNKANQTREKRDALLFIKQKIDAAQSFINAIQQRQQTLLTTMQAILDRQQEFFLTGDESRLRPMHSARYCRTDRLRHIDHLPRNE